jgi:hypothetical protein
MTINENQHHPDSPYVRNRYLQRNVIEPGVEYIFDYGIEQTKTDSTMTPLENLEKLLKQKNQ